ncbi:MAG TPA: type I methionyl aminopeptidase [Actinomycetota bacterium]|nr:type I methionyl aminopeptidase [Actinomycetota bacterium]
MIYKKSPEEIAIMRRGGKILADVMERLAAAVKPGISTQEIDAIADQAITAAGAKPSAKGYRGFPGAICTSPNDVIVHGIPSAAVILEEGDIISLDVALLYEGFHVDNARTYPVGTIDSDSALLLKATEEGLEAAIAECRPGNRIGDVGYAVEQVAEGSGFSVVREYVGHGVGRQFHEDPQVPNYGPPGHREVLTPGMTLAIEPMVNAGAGATKLLDDNWTVKTVDGSRSAHFEHTVAITEDGHEVLTRP